MHIHNINHKALIYTLKSVGVTHLILAQEKLFFLPFIFSFPSSFVLTMRSTWSSTRYASNFLYLPAILFNSSHHLMRFLFFPQILLPSSKSWLRSPGLFILHSRILNFKNYFDSMIQKSLYTTFQSNPSNSNLSIAYIYLTLEHKPLLSYFFPLQALQYIGFKKQGVTQITLSHITYSFNVNLIHININLYYLYEWKLS